MGYNTMTEKWYRISERFSIGVTPGIWGMGWTYYPTPAKRHHKVFTHWVYLRIVFAWHRRKAQKPDLSTARPTETPIASIQS